MELRSGSGRPAGQRRTRWWWMVGTVALALSSTAGWEAGGAQDVGSGGSSAVSEIRSASIFAGGLERSFRYYVPPHLPSTAPAVLVFHGAGGDGARIRSFIGPTVERLAREHGFIVAYLDGYEGHWNDCRPGVPYPAKEHNVDEVSFVRGLTAWLAVRYGVDVDRIRLFGFSNGGHVAMRLALEIPTEIQAVAAVGANLPVPEERDCAEAGPPPAVMLVNGTADPINPYEGGVAVGMGGERLGRVHSAHETIAHFAERAGHRGAGRLATVVGGGSPEDTRVERRVWSAPGTPEAVLYTVVGGGHVIPGADTSFPDLLGRMERRFNAVAEAVRFFDRQRVRRDAGDIFAPGVTRHRAPSPE